MFERVENSARATCGQLARSFFTRPTESRFSLSGAAGRKNKADACVVETVTVSTSNSAQPLVSFCKDIGVDPEAFLTSEVTGKASGVIALNTTAERFAVYGREERLFESSCAFR